MTIENLRDTLGEAKYILIEEKDIEKALSILDRMSEEFSEFQEEMKKDIEDILHKIT